MIGIVVDVVPFIDENIGSVALLLGIVDGLMLCCRSFVFSFGVIVRRARSRMSPE